MDCALFPSILICRKRDKNTKINHKNSTKRAFFMVKYKYIFREEEKLAETSLKTVDF